MSDNEKGYEVHDKRKLTIDENGDVTTNSGAETQQAEVPTPEDMRMPDLDVYSLLRSFISMLTMNVWHWMGLMKNPATGEMDKDLTQAKIAIDSIASMATQLEGKISAADQRELQSMLSDLRINFVRQSEKKE